MGLESGEFLSPLLRDCESVVRSVMQGVVPEKKMLFSRHSSDEDSCREEEILLQQEDNVKSIAAFCTVVAGRS